MGFFALECECDKVSVSAKRCDESDSVVLGDSSNKTASFCVVIFQVHLYEQISNINLQGFPLCDSVCPSKI